MYKPHEHLDIDPASDDTVIWKYLDLFKYLDLISSKSLFMLRTDKFIDPFDGKGPDKNHMRKVFALSEIPSVPDIIFESLDNFYELQRQSSYVSSWHINTYESSVMWDAYSNPNGGLVIKSTIGQLKKSITDSKDVYISKVNYDREKLGLQNVMHALVHKRMEFQDERELRVFYLDKNTFNPDILNQEYVDKLDIFQKIEVNLDDLISNAYFHPLTPEWVVNSIVAVITQYGKKFVPKKSTLYTK